MTESNGAAAPATPNARAVQMSELESDLQRRAIRINSRIRNLDGLGLSGVTHDGDRDTWSVFGWPQNLSYDDYAKQYRRGIGGRIVDLPANDTWKNPPAISEDGNTDTAFVNTTNELIERLSVWKRFDQADKLSGIGQFAIILIGLRDTSTGDDKSVSPLTEPVNVDSITESDDVIYLRPYPQDAVTEIKLDQDPQSPRFQLPELYKIQTSTQQSITSTESATSISTTSTPDLIVHWSRVLHVVRQPLTNDVLGEPSLERPFNSLQDLYTASGSATEAYWQVVWGGLTFTTQEGYKMTPEDRADLETEIDEYQNQWRRYMRLQGVDVENLGSETVDPEGLINSITAILAGESNIPRRILLGSERGELASSQDERNWASQISSRQTTFGESLVRDFIDRLILFGAVVAPESGNYNLGTKQPDGTFDWPSIFEQSENEKAEVSSNRATALKTSQDAKLLGADVSRDEVRSYGGLTSESSGDDDELEPLTPDDLVDGDAIDS